MTSECRILSSIKSDKKTFAIVVCALLFVSSISAVILYLPLEGPTDELVDAIDEPDYILDNRISPLGNQGFIFEMNRIRHRGVIDALMTKGSSWKNPPTFYYVADLDGLEYDSRSADVGFGESFNIWDTITHENKLNRDVEEETLTSTITITLYEEYTTGLLFKRTESVQCDSFTVTYDFRTGQWTGDDHLGDSEGYGHYRGETFDVWFNIYQTDYDMDYLPYWAEVNILHTDPRVNDCGSDPDEDGIPIAWEWHYGYDPFTWDDHANLDPDVDGIENIEEYQMYDWFSDPFAKDFYLEVDFTEGGSKIGDRAPHVLWEESKQAMMERYSEHNINLYIDDGWTDSGIGGGEYMSHTYDDISQDSGIMLQYYKHHFSDERKGVFRYAYIAHDAGFNHPSTFNNYDTITIGTNALRLYTINMAFTDRTQRICEASSLMHEMGHSMGVTGWTIEGCDNSSFGNKYIPSTERTEYSDTWGDYNSVMNYFHIYDKDLMDYSHGTNGDYDQNDWKSFYLPTFQLQSSVIEEVGFSDFEGKVNDEVVELQLNGWTYDENQTEIITGIIGIDHPDIIGFGIDWCVLTKTNEAMATQQNNCTIRVYCKPDAGTTASFWTLSYEGTIDPLHNTIEFYDQDSLIQDMIDYFNNQG